MQFDGAMDNQILDKLICKNSKECGGGWGSGEYRLL